MDVILHPNFDNNQRIYLSYSKPKPDDFEYATTAVFSGILENNTLIHGKDIFVAEPYLNTNHHYGCRMIFDKNGFLFVAIGERGRRDENPQYLGNDLGKIHRLNDDGTVPIDNPFYNTPHAKNRSIPMDIEIHKAYAIMLSQIKYTLTNTGLEVAMK